MKYLFSRSKNNLDWLCAFVMGDFFVSENYIELAAVFVVGGLLSGIGESMSK